VKRVCAPLYRGLRVKIKQETKKKKNEKTKKKKKPLVENCHHKNDSIAGQVNRGISEARGKKGRNLQLRGRSAEIDLDSQEEKSEPIKKKALRTKQTKGLGYTGEERVTSSETCNPRKSSSS